MENAGRDDEIEAAAERARGFDGKQMQFQISESVLFLQEAVVVERGLAHVDRHDIRPGVREGEHGGLVGATAGNQDVEIGPDVLVGPEQPVRVTRVEPLPVASEPAREVEDWLRVSPFLVLVGNDIGKRIDVHGGFRDDMGQQTTLPKPPSDTVSCPIFATLAARN